MNYTDSGQTEGQALMGFEFETPAKQMVFQTCLEEAQVRIKPIEIDQVLH